MGLISCADHSCSGKGSGSLSRGLATDLLGMLEAISSRSPPHPAGGGGAGPRHGVASACAALRSRLSRRARLPPRRRRLAAPGGVVGGAGAGRGAQPLGGRCLCALLVGRTDRAAQPTPGRRRRCGARTPRSTCRREQSAQPSDGTTKLGYAFCGDVSLRLVSQKLGRVTVTKQDISGETN